MELTSNEIKDELIPGEIVSNQLSKFSAPFVNSGLSMNPEISKLLSKINPTVIPVSYTHLTLPTILLV